VSFGLRFAAPITLSMTPGQDHVKENVTLFIQSLSVVRNMKSVSYGRYARSTCQRHLTVHIACRENARPSTRYNLAPHICVISLKRGIGG
jgi:hypothetical protein